MKLLDGLKGLPASRKATFAAILIGVLTIILYNGQLDAEKYESMVTWISTAWLGSHAAEQGMRALGKK